jgi:hypothetical protein
MELTSHLCKYSILSFIECVIFFNEVSYFTYYIRFAVGVGGRLCNDVNMVLQVHAVYGSVQQ